MRYTYSLKEPFERFACIELEINGPFEEGRLELMLPSWRPGRYELGNFAKNIRGFTPFDQMGKVLAFKKIRKDQWLVDCQGASKVTIRYEYYANQPDAGACFVDHEQLYINPVHSSFFVPGRTHEPCEVVLQVPADWQVATGLTRVNAFTFRAQDFHALVDSPFIASPNLQHGSYTLDGITFHIWFNGDCDPDWSRIIPDFEQFTKKQLEMMGGFPAQDFHFLVQMLPFAFYHGVEHLNSTVLALGPGHALMESGMYGELMGVASHELFHCWNVKTIRPAEMMPYDYTIENYAETGYVYEGVTTYYGDVILGRTGFFSLDQLLEELGKRLQRHMDNPGRFNHSVAASSFDTWLDGYVLGVPGRKVSIYDEGSLIAWMLDFMIRSATDSNRSLDDVMRMMYDTFGKKGIGYTEADFKSVCEQVAGRDFDGFFNDVIHTSSTLLNLLQETISLAGLVIAEQPSPIPTENIFGLRLSGNKVASTFPGSPAAMAGLVKDDEIVAVNGNRVEGDVQRLFAGSDSCALEVSSFGKLRTVNLEPDGKGWYAKYPIQSLHQLTAAQLRFRASWLGQ